MATAEKTAAGSSPPKWIAIVGAIVAVGGLAYTWFSHFNPKVEPPKPSAAAAPALAQPQIAASVSVSGAGALGVGVMQGGTINLGVPVAGPEAGSAPAMANSAGGNAKQ